MAGIRSGGVSGNDYDYRQTSCQRAPAPAATIRTPCFGPNIVITAMRTARGESWNVSRFDEEGLGLMFDRHDVQGHQLVRALAMTVRTPRHRSKTFQ